MIDSVELQQANEGLKMIDVKGKQYAMVNERVKAFRAICPSGSIMTEIIQMQDGVVTMRATVSDEDGNLLATGFAQEKEQASYINKTSYIENCETSAVGRALGFLGIGIDDSMGSADEVANAMRNQEIIKEMEKPATTAQRKTFTDLCEKLSLEPTQILEDVGWEGGKMTAGQYGKAMKLLKQYEDKTNA